MNRRVVWETQAVENLLIVSRQNAALANRCIEAVRRYTHGGGGDVKKLQGNTDAWRIRVGDMRITFEVDDALGAISVLTVVNRRDAYD